VTPSPNLQYFISTTHWFDAESSFDANDLERLRVDLEKLLAGQRIRLDEERAARRRSRARTVAAAATIAVIVLAAYLLWPRSSSPPATANSGAGSPGAGAPSEASRASTPGGSPVTPSPPTAATSSGVRSRVNARDGQIYVWVPPGRFAMGCSTGDPQCQPDEMPAHAVRIDKGFWLAKTEVTVGQYVARHPGWHLDIPARDDEPARDITRSDAKAYCASIGGRLPTEAEWEYAARGGTSERYYDSLSSIAWYEDNSDGHPHAVAGKEPNAYGLYDMLGNVYEWAFDRYYNKYDDTSGEIEEPLAPNASGVARGGAWTSEANDVRVSNRFDLPRDYTDPRVGFRCALDDK
jgi:formylglycine-generating enzyme required for sulfatase activity